MTVAETELEARVVRTLRAKARQVPDEVEPFDPMLAPVGGPVRRGPRRPVVVGALAAAAVAAVVVLVGLGATSTDGGDTATSPPPAGEPVATVEIQAEPRLAYQAADFYTKPGLNEIDFTSLGGTHTLVFADPELADFKLSATTNQVVTGRVVLRPGRDYEIYDAMPGHRQAGMEAVIHVS